MDYHTVARIPQNHYQGSTKPAGILQEVALKRKRNIGIIVLQIAIMKTTALIPLLLVILSFFVFMPAGISQPSPFSSQVFVNEKGDSLLYRQLIPDYAVGRCYPLVVFLHGAGERGKDNDAQLKWGVTNFGNDENKKLHPAIVIAPQCPDSLDWASITCDNKIQKCILNNAPSKPMQLLIALIHELSAKLAIDTNRIYITGLSMGGVGTYEAIQRYPHLFAAAVPVCAAGDTSRATAMKDVPIWIFHGAEDGGISPAYPLSMVEALTRAGAHPGYTQYPEVGHFAWTAAYSDPMMFEWMFRQHK